MALESLKNADRKSAASFFIQCLGFLCFLTGFCVSDWFYVTFSYGHDDETQVTKTIRVGLWRTCFEESPPGTSNCMDTTSTKFHCPGWLTGIQVMMCLAFVSYFVSIFGLMGKMFIESVAKFAYSSHPILIGNAVGTVLTTISCIVFASNDEEFAKKLFDIKYPEKHPGPVEKLSLGYIAVAIAAVLHITSGIFRFFADNEDKSDE